VNYLATFYTHYGAMQFHKLCKNENIPAKIAPVPRKLSSSCGVCVKFEAGTPPTGEHEDMEQYYVILDDDTYEKHGDGGVALPL